MRRPLYVGSLTAIKKDEKTTYLETTRSSIERAEHTQARLRPCRVISSIQLSMNGGDRVATVLRAVSVDLRERPKTFVELIGIEPTTSGLQSQRSPN